jgi:hypothetical protein
MQANFQPRSRGSLVLKENVANLSPYRRPMRPANAARSRLVEAWPGLPVTTKLHILLVAETALLIKRLGRQ